MEVDFTEPHYSDSNFPTPNLGKRELIHLHYYGTTIRAIFIVVGLVMLLSLPFFVDLTPFPLPVSIIIVVTLAIFGGLLNPSQRWVIIANTIIPAIGFVVFEYQAAYTNIHLSALDQRVVFFFWVNQVIALLFFIATYLAVKTARGRFVKEVI